MISIHDRPAIEDLRRELRVDPHRIKRWRGALLKQQQPWRPALHELPPDCRSEFAARVVDSSLQVHRRVDSPDGATKLVLRTDQGRLLESVLLRIASGRTTVCVSSQVGCAVRCQFCATGAMPEVVNLSAVEILDQVVMCDRVAAAENRRLRNLVFMGMGEPLLNGAALEAALAELLAPDGFDLSARRVVVSTVGIPGAMIATARRFPRVCFALSLHTARQEVRERLIPLARRYGLNQLHDAVQQVNAIQQQPVLIEYLMLAGINDSDDDARELTEFLRGVDVHVNLIPLNPTGPDDTLRGTPRSGRKRFATLLRDGGLTVTVRNSLGVEIGAACGQLAVTDRVAGS